MGRGKKRSRKQSGLEIEEGDEGGYGSDAMFEIESDEEDYFNQADSSDDEDEIEVDEEGKLQQLPEFQKLLKERKKYREAVRKEYGTIPGQEENDDDDDDSDELEKLQDYDDEEENNDEEEEESEDNNSNNNNKIEDPFEANHDETNDENDEIDDDFDLKNTNRFEWEEEENQDEHLPMNQVVQEAEQKKDNLKRKVLILGTRGIDARHRHLMTDLKKLIPHSKSGAKFNPKEPRDQLIRLAHTNGCNTILFFEEFHGELFIWMSMSPTGPSVRFLVENIHTMAELKLTGNCLLHSRPLLHFDTHFDTTPLTQLTKGMLTQVFSTPKGHLKSKPFVDHILSFYLLDNRIWFRNYQLVERFQGRKPSERSLVEIGPRFVLRPISVLEGAFSGRKIFENPFITFAMKTKREQQLKKKEHAEETAQRKKKKNKYLEKTKNLVSDEINNVFNE